jgi:hypothetical protein
MNSRLLKRILLALTAVYLVGTALIALLYGNLVDTSMQTLDTALLSRQNVRSNMRDRSVQGTHLYDQQDLLSIVHQTSSINGHRLLPLEPKPKSKINIHEHRTLSIDVKSKSSESVDDPRFWNLTPEPRSIVKQSSRKSKPRRIAYKKKSSTKREISPSNRVWPDSEFFEDDRIENQLHYVPRHIVDLEKEHKPIASKSIWCEREGHCADIPEGSSYFAEQGCPVKYCSFTFDTNDPDIDAVVLTNPFDPLRFMGKIVIMFMLESPYNTMGIDEALFDPPKINWTATYRRDSTVVAPYEKFTLFNNSVRTLPQTKNYARGKSKKIAWFVSNCEGMSGRMEYADELGKYMDVDIFGACGNFTCVRESEECSETLNREYKFYLSFENSKCRDYITEKFFVNGLG